MLRPYILVVMAIGLLMGCNPAPLPPLPSPTPAVGVQIAWLLPTRGEDIPLGRKLYQGSRMAIDDWQARGQADQRQVLGRVYDTPCDYEQARQVTQQAVHEGYRFIIGPLCTEAAIAAAVVAQEAEVLLIAPTALHPLVTVDAAGQPRPTVFRMAIDPTRQGQAMARWAHEQLKLTEVTVWQNRADDYSLALSQAFAQGFSQAGGQVIVTLDYDGAETDFQTKLLSSTQAIYLPAEALVVNRVANQAKTLGLTPTLLGSDSWQVGALDVGQIKTGYLTAQIVPSQVKPAWAEQYQARYAVAPDTLAILGYQATDILLTALEGAPSPDVAGVVMALTTQKFSSLDEPITFDKFHNPLRPVPILHLNGPAVEFVAYEVD